MVLLMLEGALLIRVLVYNIAGKFASNFGVQALVMHI
jgi:hypothetical protein